MLGNRRSRRASRHGVFIAITGTLLVGAALAQFVAHDTKEQNQGSNEQHIAVSRIANLGGRVWSEEDHLGLGSVTSMADESELPTRVVGVSIPLCSSGVKNYQRQMERELQGLPGLRTVHIFGSSHDDLMAPSECLDISRLRDALPSAKIVVTLH